MSNLNANPIFANADFVSWRATQTLNTGSLPGYTFKRQPGIRPYRIQLQNSAVAVTGGLVTITDPNDSTVLWQYEVLAAATTFAGVVIVDEDWDVTLPAWRDFSITGLTAANAQIFIWYRV